MSVFEGPNVAFLMDVPDDCCRRRVEVTLSSRRIDLEPLRRPLIEQPLGRI